MVDGIHYNGNVGGIDNIKGSKPINPESKETKLGSFGYGYKTGEVGFQRNVVPPELDTKFANVEIPKYTKNVAQLVIADNDFIPDQPFEEAALCEV